MEIVVVGSHELSGAPERATLHLTAGFESEDKAEALAFTTKLVGQLQPEIEALKSSQVATWFAVLPVRTRSWRPHHDKGKVVPMRHAVTADLKVKFSDFAALARFADRIGGRPGVALNHVAWALTEKTRAKVEADVLGRAVQNARARATVIAHAAGASTLEFVEITDPGLMRDVGGPGSGGYAFAAERMASHAGGDGIELVPEDIVVRTSVHVRFQAR